MRFITLQGTMPSIFLRAGQLEPFQPDPDPDPDSDPDQDLDSSKPEPQRNQSPLQGPA